jgi:hypothetical protein
LNVFLYFYYSYFYSYFSFFFYCFAGREMFSSPFDYDAAAFAIISPTCTLFNKSSSASASALGRAPGQGEGNNKGSVAPLTTYIYSDKERAIKENRGRSGVYR